jgi:environmental stress-induced protein Ves
MARLTHLTERDYETRPWKNGKGVTTEIHFEPPGGDQRDFDLRISLAPITEAGSFSSFTGADRRITLIEGEGLELDFGDRKMSLRPFEPQGFDTGLAPVGRPLGGPVRVINVMARRSRWRFADCRVVTGLDEVLAPGSLAVFFAASGSWKVEAGDGAVSLGVWDTLLANGPGVLHLRPEGQGQGIFARLEPVSEKAAVDL